MTAAPAPNWCHAVVMGQRDGAWVRLGCGWVTARPTVVPVVMLVQATCDHPAAYTARKRVAS